MFNEEKQMGKAAEQWAQGKRPVVALVRCREEEVAGSVQEALTLAGCFEGISREECILIKPNLVAWDFDLPFPPFGVVTTSLVMEALVRVLAEAGYRNLTIGEAPLPVPRSRGREMFNVLGYNRLVERYGVKLLDFNEEEFVPLKVDGLCLRVARAVLEADKIINVPVLKTHNQCVVSLGLKNLKGCLDKGSKMLCHGRVEDHGYKLRHLDHTFPLLAEKLPLAFTLIDGIYALEKGPGATGTAYRFDLLVASRDVYAADVVGAAVLGYTVPEVPHLTFFAERNGCSTEITDLEIKGLNPQTVARRLDYDWEWTPENTGPKGFAKRGISGIAVRKYDHTLCTGCSMLYNPMLILLMSAYRGRPFPNIEIITGKLQEPSPGFDYTVLWGQCACRRNQNHPHINKGIALNGCPPSLDDFVARLKEIGVECVPAAYAMYRQHIYQRYLQDDSRKFSLEHYRIN